MEVEIEIPHNLTDQEYERIASIIERSKELVTTVNKAIYSASKSTKVGSLGDSASTSERPQHSQLPIMPAPLSFSSIFIDAQSFKILYVRHKNKIREASKFLYWNLIKILN